MPETHHDWVPVVGHYLVVRLALLVERYPGGPAAFVREHGITHNDTIAVLCSSHGMEFRDIEQELDALALHDAYFESYFDGIGQDLPIGRTFDMTSWLAGTWNGAQFAVCLATR